MYGWSYWLAALFLVLFFKSLMEFLIPDGKIGRLVRDILRILVLVWIVSSLGSLLTKQDWTAAQNIESAAETGLLSDSQDPVWLEREYTDVLTDQAQEALEKEGIAIQHLNVSVNPDYTVASVEVELIPENLKESSVEIRITDITLEDPASDRSEYYRTLFSELWGIPEEHIRISIIE